MRVLVSFLLEASQSRVEVDEGLNAFVVVLCLRDLCREQVLLSLEHLDVSVCAPPQKNLQRGFVLLEM